MTTIATLAPAVVSLSGVESEAAATLPSPAPSYAQRWKTLRAVASLYGAWLAISLATGVSARFIHSPWLDVGASAAVALLVLGVAIRSRDLGALLSFRAPGPGITVRLLGVSLACAALLVGYYALLHRLGVPTLNLLTGYRTAHWPLWSAFVLIGLVPAVVEEIGFRGIIQSSLTRVTGAREAWIIQAALFSVLHLSPVIFIDHFFMGLCFGYLRRRSRSLYPSMVMHAAWNSLVLLQELVG